MTRINSKQRGYSLAEVLVAVAVFALIILAALMIYDRSNRTFKLGVEASNLQQNTRVAFDKLVADLRMTGFDFDRDGIPVGSAAGATTYQQPDEQFEFIAPGAITIRSNFDFEEEATPCNPPGVADNCDNGRERTLESAEFPVVTTGNDEIVTYALVPDSQTTIPACNAATNCVEFFADTNNPRQSYANPGAGGLDESTVQIPGVDLCIGGCNNPPYTLYRFSLDRTQSNFAGGNNVIRTPLATNIRSMTVTYYEDSNGTVELRDINNVVNISTGAPILGKGKWQAANPGALVAERSVRSKINAIRISLVGMTEVSDPAYTDTAETVASARTYRKYRLDTLVAPRNIQKRGMKEQDTYPPCAPTITSVCTGACNGVFLRWSAPAVNAACGAPDQYQVIYDANVAGTSWDCDFNAFTNTSANIFGTKPGCTLTSGAQFRMAVVALNSYGKSAPSNIVTPTVRNSTKPGPPTLTSTTNNLNGKVTLTWDRNTTFLGSGFSCSLGASAGAQTSSGEVDGYYVERRVAGSGQPFVQVAGPADFGGTTDNVTFSDMTALNCVDYEYRIATVEYCQAAPNMNASNNTIEAVSDYSNIMTGRADAGGLLPEAPPDLSIDQTASALTCSVGGTCDVSLSWPKSTKDMSGNSIAIGEYRIYRQQIVPAASGWTQVGTQTTIPAGPTVTYVDTGVPWTTGLEQYRYRITAVQCTTLESAPSPERVFPCTASSGIVNPTLPLSSNAFDGAGTPGYPYLVVQDAAVAVNVVSTTNLNRITGRIYDQGGVLRQQIDLYGPSFAMTPTSPAYTFLWTLGNNATERIDVTVVDNAGCVEIFSAYVRDEDQACCLRPLIADPTVVSYTSGSNFVDVFLKNECPETLNMQQVHLIWSSAIAGGNPQRVNFVDFPTPLGGTVSFNAPNSNDFTFNVPVGAAQIAPNQQNYKIRIRFNRTLNNPSQPFTLLDFDYNQPPDPTLTNDCRAIP